MNAVAADLNTKVLANPDIEVTVKAPILQIHLLTSG